MEEITEDSGLDQKLVATRQIRIVHMGDALVASCLLACQRYLTQSAGLTTSSLVPRLYARRTEEVFRKVPVS